MPEKLLRALSAPTLRVVFLMKSLPFSLHGVVADIPSPSVLSMPLICLLLLILVSPEEHFLNYSPTHSSDNCCTDESLTFTIEGFINFMGQISARRSTTGFHKDKANTSI